MAIRQKLKVGFLWWVRFTAIIMLPISLYAIVGGLIFQEWKYVIVPLPMLYMSINWLTKWKKGEKGY